MKLKENNLMKEYQKDYDIKRKSYDKQFKVSSKSEKLKDVRFDLDIMEISISKYVANREKGL